MIHLTCIHGWENLIVVLSSAKKFEVNQLDTVRDGCLIYFLSLKKVTTFTENSNNFVITVKTKLPRSRRVHPL